MKEQEEEEAVALWSSSWCPSCCLELNLGSNTLRNSTSQSPTGKLQSWTALAVQHGQPCSFEFHRKSVAINGYFYS